MGSMSNPNPWAPYDSYTDCSQGVCNIYCPQWCYLIFPPPPPSFLDDSSSSSKFSPLLIALIGILVSAFVLVSYYTLVSKYCHRRRENSTTHPDDDSGGGAFSSSATEPRQRIANPAAGGGLNDSLIKSITVYKYRKGDGFVDGSDCSVCLSEFMEEESLRLLPKCNHAFHLPCIDTWLKSHSNCPLCRSIVTGVNPTTVVANQPSSGHQIVSDSGNRGGATAEINSTTGEGQHETSDSVVVIEDLETGSRNINGRSIPQTSAVERRETKDEVTLPIRRSVSLNSGIVVSIADVLREMEDNKRYQKSAGIGTSQQRQEEGDEEERVGHGKRPPSTAENQRNGVSNFLVRSRVAMKRSVSTGRFIIYDQSRNYRLPN